MPARPHPPAPPASAGKPAIDSIFFLILRRMRMPLLMLVLSYSIAIVGLVLIPGRAADGQAWRMDFFHAFYFISYVATTIGFGEIPHAFSAAQRLWVIFCIHGTVIAWLYSIGTLIALLRDKTLQRALAENRFAAQVRALPGPFYLICGYGQTGSGLLRALAEDGPRAGGIGGHADRINQLKLENLPYFVPALHADARDPEHLLLGGLRKANCAGVLALTSSNEVNLKIALASKLLHPRLKVICRADSHDIEANMASFGTDHIYDPFDIFALYFATAMQAPCLTALLDWLIEPRGSALREPHPPPATGHWILCGFGRFGRALHRHLTQLDLNLVVIEAAPERTGTPPGHWIHGRGTEADTLEQADIHSAVGLIAGTDNDTNNLSIMMTARALNPDLYVVARQNQIINAELFDAVGADLRMHPSLIVAQRIRLLLRAELLNEFVNYARYEDDRWACELVSRMLALVIDQVPEVWELCIDADQAPALLHARDEQWVASIGDLLRDPHQREARLAAIVLMRRRGNDRLLLPGNEERLREGDRLLCCGSARARGCMRWIIGNRDVLAYVLLGQTVAHGWVWRRLQAARRAGGDSESRSRRE